MLIESMLSSFWIVVSSVDVEGINMLKEWSNLAVPGWEQEVKPTQPGSLSVIQPI